MFIRNCWYVAAWSHELDDQPISRQIIGEPIVLFRTSEGGVHAFEDRCPHRHAPLSLGRIEEDRLRCMYHGLLFNRDGVCTHVPGSATIPESAKVRVFPVVEQDSWLWVWLGDLEKADPALIPKAFGLESPERAMRSGQIDYEANYQLINDNLCDLSHVDFVHEGTLGKATGYGWSDETGRVTSRDRAIRIERWLVARPASPTNPTLVDTWNTYDYHLPGVFVMESRSYPHGMAERCQGAAPNEKPMTYRVEQQAVTPIDGRRTRYFFATGFDSKNIPQKVIDSIFEVVMAAFAEDRTVIEAQQKIWDLTPAEKPKSFIEHDKGPQMFRRLLSRTLTMEAKSA